MTTPIVLLVDDDQRVLSSLERSLRRETYAVETAESGERALERLRRGPTVALVLSDFRMTGMNGVELLTAVRREYPATVRMLFSGWIDEIAPAEIAAAEITAIHQKPWDDGELKASIRAALGLA